MRRIPLSRNYALPGTVASCLVSIALVACIATGTAVVSKTEPKFEGIPNVQALNEEFKHLEAQRISCGDEEATKNLGFAECKYTFGTMDLKGEIKWLDHPMSSRSYCKPGDHHCDRTWQTGSTGCMFFGLCGPLSIDKRKPDPVVFKADVIGNAKCDFKVRVGDFDLSVDDVKKFKEKHKNSRGQVTASMAIRWFPPSSEKLLYDVEKDLFVLERGGFTEFSEWHHNMNDPDYSK